MASPTLRSNSTIAPRPSFQKPNLHCCLAEDGRNLDRNIVDGFEVLGTLRQAGLHIVHHVDRICRLYLRASTPVFRLLTRLVVNCRHHRPSVSPIKVMSFMWVSEKLYFVRHFVFRDGFRGKFGRRRHVR